MTLVDGGFDKLLEVLGACEADAGDTRRLTDEVVRAFAAGGLNRSLLPSALGGDERHPREVVSAIAAVAAIDASAAWCGAISAGSNHFAGYVPEDVARRTYVDPDGGGAGMFQPAGVATVSADGASATLKGRWPFTSNCLHSRWIGVGAWVESADGTREPSPRLVIVPADGLTIEDTWRGNGLRATGSHHVRADDLEIDLRRSCSFADRPWAEGQLWRMPLFTVLAPMLAAVPLGVARGAIDHLQERMTSGAAGVRGTLLDDPVGLSELAEADTAVRCARAGLLTVLGEAWDAAAADGVPRELQGRLFLAVLHASDVGVSATSTAHRLIGGAGAFEEHPLSRALRDVHTSRQHVMFSHQHRPGIMRIAAGLDETLPPFVI